MTDFTLLDEGSISLLECNSDQAVAWVEENVSGEGFQPYWPSRLVVEARYVQDILSGILDDGLTVDV